MRFQSTMSLVLLSAFAAGFACAQAPVAIDGIYPSSGLPGTTVILKGRGFAVGDTQFVWAPNIREDAAPGFVEFNGARAEVKLWQDNLVMLIVPPNATSGPVRLTLRSGISVQGNHFDISGPEGSEPLRDDYAFLERKGMSDLDYIAFNRGLYQSPDYFYYGRQPAFVQRRVYDFKNWNRCDGMMDMFMFSGPLLSTCQMVTGLDNVMVMPSSFYGDYMDRRDYYWSGSPGRAPRQTSPRKRYSFLE